MLLSSLGLENTSIVDWLSSNIQILVLLACLGLSTKVFLKKCKTLLFVVFGVGFFIFAGFFITFLIIDVVTFNFFNCLNIIVVSCHVF